MLDLIISGGTVVTPHTTAELDVGITGEHIVAVGQPGTLNASAGRVIDATGKIVLPGGIEPHAHIGIPVPPDWTGQPDVMTQPPRSGQSGGRVRWGDDHYRFCRRPVPQGAARRTDVVRCLEVLERRRARPFATTATQTFAFHYTACRRNAATRPAGPDCRGITRGRGQLQDFYHHGGGAFRTDICGRFFAEVAQTRAA